MHAPTDTVVGIGNASDIFRAARHPKSFIALDSADHLLSQDDDSAYAGGVLAAWAARYMPFAAVGSPLHAAQEPIDR
jgi:putative redox protein